MHHVDQPAPDETTSDAIEAAKERYEAERAKRLHAEGLAQYHGLDDEFEDFDRDPWVEPGFVRDPVVTDVDVAILGGGYGGILAAVHLQRRGVDNVRIIEKAGDFGGTWYWNRYPGCMCDVESYIYMPFLEETGYMPTQRYASATEIFEHCRRIGRHFDLYPKALFQTEVTSAVWDDDTNRWTITTSRGDLLCARFFLTASGILHKAKLPAIKGVTDFEGRAFHTARWDYSYTGGSPTEPMDRLADQRVGIIGTGATAIQVVPQLARTAKEVFVFQRTPSAVGVRANSPTDEAWFRSLPAGWQRRRTENFTAAVTGDQPAENLVGDGWTKALWTQTQVGGDTAEERAALEAEDFETMESMRARIDEVVADPETREKLKPWYGKHCKRLCFHDEYLQAFNQPNVHLVDTDGLGVREIAPEGPVVDGEPVPVDLLIYASGFEVTTGLVSRLGFDPVGRGGVRMSERWANGAHTLHGILSHGFPNMLICHFVQAGFGLNFTHYLGELTDHVTWLAAKLLDDDVASIEATVEAEDEWLATLWSKAAAFGRYSAKCTPSYSNSEGALDEQASRNIAHPGNFLHYLGYLREWREAGDYPGTVVTTAT